MTRSSCVARCVCAVVNVLAAVISGPAIHTDAVISTLRVQTRPTVLTGIGHQVTLVDVFGTELTCPLRLALAVVCVYSIHTGSSIQTLVVRAVIYILFTVLTTETWQTGTLMAGVALLYAGAPMEAW